MRADQVLAREAFKPTAWPTMSMALVDPVPPRRVGVFMRVGQGDAPKSKASRRNHFAHKNGVFALIDTLRAAGQHVVAAVHTALLPDVGGRLERVREQWSSPSEHYCFLGMSSPSRTRLSLTSVELFRRIWKAMDGDDSVEKASYLEAARFWICAEIRGPLLALQEGKARLGTKSSELLRWVMTCMLAPDPGENLFHATPMDPLLGLRRLLHKRISKVHPDKLFTRTADPALFLSRGLIPNHDAKIVLEVLDILRLLLRRKDICQGLKQDVDALSIRAQDNP